MVHEYDGILQKAPTRVKPRRPARMLGRDVNPRYVAMPVRLQMEMEEHRAVPAVDCQQCARRRLVSTSSERSVDGMNDTPVGLRHFKSHGAHQ